MGRIVIIGHNIREKKNVLQSLGSELIASLFLVLISGMVCYFLVVVQAISWWFLGIISVALATISLDNLQGKEEAGVGRVFLFLAFGMVTGAVLASVPQPMAVFLIKPFVQALGITILIGLVGMMLVIAFKPEVPAGAWVVVTLVVFSFSLMAIYHLQPRAVFVRWIAFGGICLLTLYETISAVNSRIFGENNYLRYPLALVLNAILLAGLLLSPFPS